MFSSILALKSSRLVVAISLAGALLITPSVLAAPASELHLTATGYIASQTLCSATEACQESIISGVATQLGRFDAVLVERVNLLDGSFTGTTTLTMPNGDTIRTISTGQITSTDESGLTHYVEHHEIVGGTGRFAQTTGEFDVVGTADSVTFELAAVGVGEILLKGE